MGESPGPTPRAPLIPRSKNFVLANRISPIPLDLDEVSLTICTSPARSSAGPTASLPSTSIIEISINSAGWLAAPPVASAGCRSIPGKNAALVDTGETDHVALLLSPDGGTQTMQIYIGGKRQGRQRQSLGRFPRPQWLGLRQLLLSQRPTAHQAVAPRLTVRLILRWTMA